MSRDTLYLQHVLDAIEKVERYVAVGHVEFILERRPDIPRPDIP